MDRWTKREFRGSVGHSRRLVSCPDMLGFRSIKAVLPTIAADMDYAQLEGIQQGNEASLAYLEAIHPETSTRRKEEIRKDLLKYCKHDTEAMVRLVHFFADN